MRVDTDPNQSQIGSPAELAPSLPLELAGRVTQFHHLVQVLSQDGDFLVVGVPGSGRRRLIRLAAQQVAALVLEVDCIRVTDGTRFVQLLCDSINQTFNSSSALSIIQQWVAESAHGLFTLAPKSGGLPQIQPLRDLNREQLWHAFEILLQLPQLLAETLGCRVVLILQSFPHIRSWDRNGQWETLLRQEIKRQTEVSYALVATIAETTTAADSDSLDVVQLGPLANDVLRDWVQSTLAEVGLTLADATTMNQFLSAVQGHVGDAVMLVRRLTRLKPTGQVNGQIDTYQLQQVLDDLLLDISGTFESLVLLLPASQVQLLECLSLYPTDKPQSREYIQQHGLSRGGSLQGALIGLQQKGLIYGAEYGYRVALPLLSLWIRQRLM